MRRPAFAVLPLLCFAWLLHTTFSTPQLRSQSSAPPAPVAQFRIAVGLSDSAAKPWQGSIAVTGASLESLSGWRFSQTDQADSSGKFQFQTKIGAFENQMLPGEKFGQTGWDDKRMQRLIPQGLIVRTRGSDGGRIRFESGSGSFE